MAIKQKSFSLYLTGFPPIRSIILIIILLLMHYVYNEGYIIYSFIHLILLEYMHRTMYCTTYFVYNMCKFIILLTELTGVAQVTHTHTHTHTPKCFVRFAYNGQGCQPFLKTIEKPKEILNRIIAQKLVLQLQSKNVTAKCTETLSPPPSMQYVLGKNYR